MTRASSATFSPRRTSDLPAGGEARAVALGAGLSLGAVVFVGFAAPLLSGPVHNAPAVLTLLVTLLVLLLALCVRVAERVVSLPTLFALLYLAVVETVPALYVVSSNEFYWSHHRVGEPAVLAAAALNLAFVVAFACGQALPGASRRVRDPRPGPRGASGAREMVIALVVMAAAASAVIAITRLGLDTLLRLRGEFGTLLTVTLDRQAGGLLLALPRALTFSALLLCLHALATCGTALARATFLLLLAAIVPLFAVVNYPPAQARFWLFGMAIAASLMVFRFRSARSRLALVLLFIVGLYTVFPVASALTRGGTTLAEIRIPTLSEYVKTGDFSNFEGSVNAVAYVAHEGHTHGRQILSSLLFFVPRAIWTGKAQATGTMVAKHHGFGYTNLSSSIVAELYVDFSILGVLAGGALIGYAYRRLDRLCDMTARSRGVTLEHILVALLCGFTIILFRGSLLGVIGPVAVSLGCVLAVLLVPSGRERA